MKRKLFLSTIILSIAITACLQFPSFARGGFGGGGHSFGGGGRSFGGGFSSGRSSFSSGRSQGWGSRPSRSESTPAPAPAPSRTSGSGWGTGKRSQAATGGTSKSSEADKALYAKAKMQGTAFKTKEEAVTAFKTKHANDYNTKFSSEPSKRPDYIPMTTQIGGREVPVQYDSRQGGYGFLDTNGKWRTYEVIRDVAMLGLLMHRDNYAYGPPPGYGGYPAQYGGPYGQPYYPQQPHFPWGFVIFVMLIIGVVFLVKSAKKAAQNQAAFAGADLPSDSYSQPQNNYGGGSTVASPQSLSASDPEFWLNVAPGTIVTLKDEQTIEDSMRKGLGAKPIDYVVSKVRQIEEQDGMVRWTLCLLQDAEQQIWFMAKAVDRSIDFRAYYEPEEFQQGDRRDMVENGNLWIFQEPDDVNNYRLSELRFTTSIRQEQDVEGGTREVGYDQKVQGVLYGSMTSNPPETGFDGGVFTTVVEYASGENGIENPELLLLEFGGETGGDGGLISLMVGAPLRKTDFDVVKR